jgi:hypothetical protein
MRDRLRQTIGLRRTIERHRKIFICRQLLISTALLGLLSSWRSTVSLFREAPFGEGVERGALERGALERDGLGGLVLGGSALGRLVIGGRC